MDTEKDTSVRVAVRIRPLLGKEKQEKCTECVLKLSETVVMMMGKEKQFTFDSVFGTSSKQDSIYDKCVAPLVKNFFCGYNATVLAYGQTGSGKTYTMGTSAEGLNCIEDYGVIPRAMSQIFEHIEEKKQQVPGAEFYLRVQFLEVYGEEIRDLLDPEGTLRGKSVTIRDTNGDSNGNADGVQVVGAIEESVKSSQDMFAALERGSLHRITASTNMNNHSSRSHAIFTIIIEQHIPRPDLDESEGKSESKEDESEKTRETGKGEESESQIEGDPEIEYRTAKFHFVDLAGSERAKRTGATGTRLKEGININMGLLALGNVISALGDEKNKGMHVPYRSSKLTRMLQDSLGGNSRTLMVACVSPADWNFEETMNALRYANRARNIKNKPIVNRDPKSSQISKLKQEINKLRMQLRNGTLPPGVNNDFIQDGTMPSAVDNQLREKCSELEQDLEDALRRASDAEEQMNVLSGAVEKEKRSRSEMQEKYVLMVSEVDYYKQKYEIKDESADDGETRHEDDEEKKKKIQSNASYLRKIEDLQNQLASSDAELAKHRRELEQFKGGFTGDLGDFSDPTHEMVSAEKLRLEYGIAESGSDDESEDENESSTDFLSTSPTKCESAEINPDDDEDTVKLKKRFQQSQNNLKEMVNTYDVTLKSKQMAMQRIVEERKRYETMKAHYEEKMKQLSVEVKETQGAKSELEEKIKKLENLRKTSKSTGKDGNLDKLRLELRKKNDKLKQLERDTKQITSLKSSAAKLAKKERDIQREITFAKAQKVEYQRKMELNSKKYREDVMQKRREIAQLKKHQLVLQREKSKIAAKSKRDENLLKAKTEQATALSRKLRMAQKMTKHSKQLTEKEKKQRTKLEKWAKERIKKEEELDNLRLALEKKDKAIQKKEKLCEELRMHKKKAERRANMAEKIAEKQQKAMKASTNQVSSNAKKSTGGLQEIFQSGVEESSSVKIKLGDNIPNMTAEEKEALEELEQRLEICETEILFREQECERVAANVVADDTESDEDVEGKKSSLKTSSSAGAVPAKEKESLPVDFSTVPEAKTVVRELLNMYAEAKKQKKNLRSEVKALREQVKKMNSSENLSTNMRRRQSMIPHGMNTATIQLGSPHVKFHSPSNGTNPHIYSTSTPPHSARRSSITNSNSRRSPHPNYGGKVAEGKSAGLDNIQKENLMLKELLNQAGVKYQDGGNIQTLQLLEQLEHELLDHQVTGSLVTPERRVQTVSDVSVYDRLSNVENWTGTHKYRSNHKEKRTNQNTSSAKENTRNPNQKCDEMVDEMYNIPVPDTQVDELFIINEPTTISGDTASPNCPSPSFFKATESYKNRRALESADRERRDSSGSTSSKRKGFVSSGSRPSSSSTNIAHLETSHKLKNTYTQSGNRGRQMAWDTKSLNSNQKLQNDCNSSVRQSSSTSGKENSNSSKSGEEDVHVRLSHPSNYTGTHKQKLIDKDKKQKLIENQDDVLSASQKKSMRLHAMKEERARRKQEGF